MSNFDKVVGRSRGAILKCSKFVKNGLSFIKKDMDINFEAKNSKFRVLNNFEFGWGVVGFNFKMV